MGRPLAEKLSEWILSLTDGEEIEEANARIQQMAETLFEEYEPTKGPYSRFHQRLDSWLNNVPDEEEQKILFRLVPLLFFLGPREIENLQRVAFNRYLARWLIEQLGLMIDDPHADAQLKSALNRTWICPITDSMRINAFYHLNNIAGRDYRPDWRSLHALGDMDKIEKFLTEERIERIVLLEDFVGSGSQIKDAVKFAARLPSKPPILVIPLVLCPSGAQMLEDYQRIFRHIEYKAVVRLEPADFLNEYATSGEPAISPSVRILTVRYYPKLLVGISREERKQLYGPFGFGRTGGLVVMWTNCPDNTLPAIHRKSAEWHALFPRASRL